MNSELKKIKKYYGEEMMHLCRELFSTILEEEGALLDIFESKFPHSKFLYEDIVKDNKVTAFKDFIYEIYNSPPEEEKTYEEFVSPFVLMDRAGYTLYECHSENDIQSFRKYYAKGEELCTFAGGRLENYHVFFAVKKNVLEIKRENFPNPDRQDEYGTSVISIQYYRGPKNTLSVKNRYNHTVNNPDATFSNNLDNIIPGLNDSFEMAFNLSCTGSHDKFELSNYVMAKDGKYYKYNHVVDLAYFGPDNVVIDNFSLVTEYLEKEKYLVLDNIIIDLVNKTIYSYDESDKYIKGLNNISKIDIVKDGNKKTVTLIMKNGKKVIFKVNRLNMITEIYDEYTKKIPDNSLLYLTKLHDLTMPNVLMCGDNFLLNNAVLSKVNMPEITYIGDNFLRYNIFIKELDFPKVEYIGSGFMRGNDEIKELNFPKLVRVGGSFMDFNKKINKVVMPEVTSVGNRFLSVNNNITTLDMPKLRDAGSDFMAFNKRLKKIVFPSLVSVGYGFFKESMATSINLPNLMHAESCFMQHNYTLEEIEFPKLVVVKNNFLSGNRSIRKAVMPNLVSCGDYFMAEAEEIKIVDFPRLKVCGEAFMLYGHNVDEIKLPALEVAGPRFIAYAYKPKMEFLKNMVEDKETSKLVRKKAL